MDKLGFNLRLVRPPPKAPDSGDGKGARPRAASSDSGGSIPREGSLLGGSSHHGAAGFDLSDKDGLLLQRTSKLDRQMDAFKDAFKEKTGLFDLKDLDDALCSLYDREHWVAEDAKTKPEITGGNGQGSGKGQQEDLLGLSELEENNSGGGGGGGNGGGNDKRKSGGGDSSDDEEDEGFKEGSGKAGGGALTTRISMGPTSNNRATLEELAARDFDADESEPNSPIRGGGNGTSGGPASPHKDVTTPGSAAGSGSVGGDAQKKKGQLLFAVIKLRSEEEIMQNLDPRLFDGSFDPVLAIIDELPDDLSEHDEHVEVELREKDMAKDAVIKQLSIQVTKNYSMLVEGMKQVQLVDLDLARTGVHMTNARRRLASATGGTMAFLQVLRLQKRLERLHEVHILAKEMKEVVRAEDAINDAIKMGRFPEAIVSAAELEQNVASGPLANVWVMRAVRARARAVLPRMRDALQSALFGLCMGFSAVEYARTVKAYLLLEERGVLVDGSSSPAKAKRSGAASVGLGAKNKAKNAAAAAAGTNQGDEGPDALNASDAMLKQQQEQEAAALLEQDDEDGDQTSAASSGADSGFAGGMGASSDDDESAASDSAEQQQQPSGETAGQTAKSPALEGSADLLEHGEGEESCDALSGGKSAAADESGVRLDIASPPSSPRQGISSEQRQHARDGNRDSLTKGGAAAASAPATLQDAEKEKEKEKAAQKRFGLAMMASQVQRCFLEEIDRQVREAVVAGIMEDHPLLKTYGETGGSSSGHESHEQQQLLSQSNANQQTATQVQQQRVPTEQERQAAELFGRLPSPPAAAASAAIPRPPPLPSGKLPATPVGAGNAAGAAAGKLASNTAAPASTGKAAVNTASPSGAGKALGNNATSGSAGGVNAASHALGTGSATSNTNNSAASNAVSATAAASASGGGEAMPHVASLTNVGSVAAVGLAAVRLPRLLSTIGGTFGVKSRLSVDPEELQRHKLAELVNELPASQLLPTLLRVCRGMAELMHAHYLMAQWHLSPFDERNEDDDFLYRSPINHKRASAPGGSTSSPPNLGAMSASSQNSNGGSKGGERGRPRSSGKPPGGANSVAADSAADLGVRSQLAVLEEAIRAQRSVLWARIERSLERLLSAAPARDGSLGLEGLASLLGMLHIFVALGEEFCGKPSPALRRKLAEKAEQFFDSKHAEALQVLRQMLERELWQRVPVSLREMGGLDGLLKATARRFAVADSAALRCISPAWADVAGAVAAACALADGSSGELGVGCGSLQLSVARPGSPPLLLGGSAGQNVLDLSSLFMAWGARGNPFAARWRESESSSTDAEETSDALATSTSTGTTASAKEDSDVSDSSEDGEIAAAVQLAEEAVPQEEGSADAERYGTRWVVTQASLNGLGRYMGYYLEVMALLKPSAVARAAWERICLLVDEYLYSIFTLFVPPKAAALLWAEPDESGAPMPSDRELFAPLRLFLERLLHQHGVTLESLARAGGRDRRPRLGFPRGVNMPGAASASSASNSLSPDGRERAGNSSAASGRAVSPPVAGANAWSNSNSGGGGGGGGSGNGDSDGVLDVAHAMGTAASAAAAAAAAGGRALFGGSDTDLVGLSARSGGLNDSRGGSGGLGGSGGGSAAVASASSGSQAFRNALSRSSASGTTAASAAMSAPAPPPMPPGSPPRKIPLPAGVDPEQGSGEANLFGLGERAVAAESCLFVARLLRTVYQRVAARKLLPAHVLAQCEEYVRAVTLAAPRLRLLVYRGVAPVLVGADRLALAVGSQRWQLAQIQNDVSPYVEGVCERCEVLRAAILSSGQGRGGGGVAALSVPLPPAAQRRAWAEALQAVLEALVDGFSRAKSCSTEGRALMSMDLQAICGTLERPMGRPLLTPERGRAYALAYVNAFYYNQADLVAWVEQNWKMYRPAHMAALLLCEQGSGGGGGGGGASLAVSNVAARVAKGAAAARSKAPKELVARMEALYRGEVADMGFARPPSPRKAGTSSPPFGLAGGNAAKQRVSNSGNASVGVKDAREAGLSSPPKASAAAAANAAVVPPTPQSIASARPAESAAGASIDLLSGSGRGAMPPTEGNAMGALQGRGSGEAYSAVLSPLAEPQLQQQNDDNPFSLLDNSLMAAALPLHQPQLPAGGSTSDPFAPAGDFSPFDDFASPTPLLAPSGSGSSAETMQPLRLPPKQQQKQDDAAAPQLDTQPPTPHQQSQPLAATAAQLLPAAGLAAASPAEQPQPPQQQAKGAGSKASPPKALFPRRGSTRGLLARFDGTSGGAGGSATSSGGVEEGTGGGSSVTSDLAAFGESLSAVGDKMSAAMSLSPLRRMGASNFFHGPGGGSKGGNLSAEAGEGGSGGKKTGTAPGEGSGGEARPASGVPAAFAPVLGGAGTRRAGLGAFRPFGGTGRGQGEQQQQQQQGCEDKDTP